MQTPTSTLAPWRRRYLAPAVGFPHWARDQPERLVYGSNSSGKWELYTWDRARDEHRQATDRPDGTTGAILEPGGEAFWWFDDDHGNEFGAWMRQPFEGGEARPALPGLAAAYSAGLVLGRDVVVVGSSTETGSVIHLVRSGSDPVELYRHREYATAETLSRDETLLAIEHSERGDTQHPAVRILNLDGTAAGEIDDGPGLGVRAGAWAPVRGDQRLLIQHERSGLARPAIWSAETGEVDDLEIDLPGDVDASWYPDGERLLIHHDHHGRGELYAFQLGTQTLEPLNLPRGVISSCRVRPDGEVWFAWSDAAHPPEIRGAAGTVLTAPGDRAPAGAPYADLWAGSVHAFVAEPAGSRPHPTVFLVHGGPTAHVQDSFAPVVQSFVDHGFAVVMVNYRGSTGYGREWRDALIGRPGFTELEDVAAVYDAAVASGITDRERVVLFGRSWGGYLTLLGLGTQPERWALGVAGVPVADYVAAFEDEMEPLKAYDRSLFGGGPAELPELYRRSSPLTYIDDVRVPVLVLAGENDPRCPIRQIDNYLERLRALGKPHEVHRSQAGHASLEMSEVLRQQELILGFCARHLGTTPPL